MLSMVEAWNTASGTTGLNQVESGFGWGMALALVVLEVLWWVMVVKISRRHINARRSQNQEKAT